MKKGLVISWYFPPINSSEGLCTFKLLKNSPISKACGTPYSTSRGILGLTEATAKTGSGRFLDLFEYLEKQRAMLPQNPSVTALCSALAAFCGAA